jgi:site-specific DNA recombinase
MKYFIYCRKSSEEDSKQVQSLGTQERIMVDFAVKNNLKVVDILKESKSAKDAGTREVYNKMLVDINKGKADGILVEHTDRLARNFIDAGKLLDLMGKGILKEIATPYRSFSSVQDTLYMGFDFVFATHYSAQLGVKVKEGIDSKVLKGEYPTHAPLGYYNKEGKIYIDKSKAPYFKRLFELYATGEYSIKEVGNILYKEGLRTKGGYKVSKTVLHRALKNPIYRGDLSRPHFFRHEICGLKRPLGFHFL